MARFLSAAVILIAIALMLAVKRYHPTSVIFQRDIFPSATPQVVRTLVLDYPYAAPCFAIFLAVIGGAVSFSRKVFLGVAATSAAAGLLAVWTGILFWVLMNLIEGFTG